MLKDIQVLVVEEDHVRIQFANVALDMDPETSEDLAEALLGATRMIQASRAATHLTQARVQDQKPKLKLIRGGVLRRCSSPPPGNKTSA